MNFVASIVYSLFFLVSFAYGQVVVINTAQMLATQEGVGFQYARDIAKVYVSKYYKEAGMVYDAKKTLPELLNEVKKTGKMNDCVAFINKDFQGSPFPGALAQDGKSYYHFDGHHRSRAIVEINKVIDDISPDVKVRLQPAIDVKANFTGISDEKLAAEFKRMNKGYILPQNRGNYKSDLDIVKSFKKSIEAVPDYPPRSLMGSVFFKNGIDSKKYADYIEFLVLEDLDPKFKNLRPGTTITPEMIESAEKNLFLDSKKVEKLSSYARSADDALVVKTEVEFKHFKLRQKYKVKSLLPPEQKAIHEIFSAADDFTLCH